MVSRPTLSAIALSGLPPIMVIAFPLLGPFSLIVFSNCCRAGSGPEITTTILLRITLVFTSILLNRESGPINRALFFLDDVVCDSFPERLVSPLKSGIQISVKCSQSLLTYFSVSHSKPLNGCGCIILS